MKRYIKIKLIGLAFLVAVIAGCDTASQEVADVVSPDGYPVATFTTDASGTTFAEGDTIIYTVKIDKMMDNAISFSASVISGTASDADFDVTTGVIEPYTDSTSIQIIVLRDNDADPDETVTLEIGAMSVATKYLLNPSTVNPTMDFTITNYESPVLEMSFSWDTEIEVNPNYPEYPDYVDIEHASDIDFDIFLPDWSVYAATGSEPEEMSFDGLEDGDYEIWCELWANPFVDSAWLATGYGMTVEEKKVPITAHFLQMGVMETTLVQDDSQVFTTSSAGADDDAWDGETPVDTYVCGVTVAGTTYTITDYDGEVVMKGQAKDFKFTSSRPAHLRK